MSTDILFWLATHWQLVMVVAAVVWAVSLFRLVFLVDSTSSNCRSWGLPVIGFFLPIPIVIWAIGFGNQTAFRLANDHLRYVPAQISKPAHGWVAARAGGRSYNLQIDPALDDTRPAKNPAIKALSPGVFSEFKTIKFKPATKEHPAGSQQAYVVLTLPSPELSPANQRRAQRLDHHLEPFLVINKYEKVK